MESQYNNIKTKQLVVAKYKESIDWLKQVAGFDIIVYNKDSTDINPSFKHLLNIGKEAHTYLTHIIENYDNLADYTIFCQGRPFDHCPDFLEQIHQPVLADFTWYTKAVISRHWAHRHHKQFLNVKEILNAAGLYKLPDRTDFGVGAQFGLTRELILQKPKCYYIKLIDNFKRENIYEGWLRSSVGLESTTGLFWKRHGVYNFYFTACAFERIWWYIFNHPHFNKDLIRK
jgi:hypothetical protein